MKKVALVTGGSRGIGLGVVKELLANDYYVVVSARSKEYEPSDEILLNHRGDWEYVSCDISSSEERKELISGVVDRLKRIDLLVNNAGVAPKERLNILETTEESYDFVVDTNTKATFFMCQLAANAMVDLQSKIEDYHPRIVNISSMSAYTSSTNRGEYCISKAGISMITKLYADYLAQYGIPVFEVRPGIIETDMIATVKGKYEKLIDEGITPIKRLGLPKDVANCVVAAASGLLDFSTGQVLNADGGFHLRRM